MRFHFIAVGGSIMHNLALSMHDAGHDVSGSDDEIYEPSRSRLKEAGLLPVELGWDPSIITPDINTVIVGMHARKDNPELRRARELGLPVKSFPEFVAAMAADKFRVVIAGSHGKTTTTSMIMHVLKETGQNYDYLVGAQLPGYTRMVRLSDAPVMVIEGDEYLSSPLDRRPKFLHYDPDVAVITGIAWDHMNVFSTEEIYTGQFEKFISSLRSDVKLYLFEGDKALRHLASRNDCKAIYYNTCPFEQSDGAVYAIGQSGRYPMQFFGEHNFQNLQAVLHVCQALGVSREKTLQAMQSFRGASMRLERIVDREDLTVFRDFAHAPSKVRATTKAVRQRFRHDPLSIFLELHTFSSLNREFMPGYANSLSGADLACVYYSPHTLEMKRLPAISPQFVEECFGGDVEVFTDTGRMIKAMHRPARGVHLWMSSGRFGGLDIRRLYQDDD